MTKRTSLREMDGRLLARRDSLRAADAADRIVRGGGRMSCDRAAIRAIRGR